MSRFGKAVEGETRNRERDEGGRERVREGEKEAGGLGRVKKRCRGGGKQGERGLERVRKRRVLEGRQ